MSWREGKASIPGQASHSRAINLSMEEKAVRAACAKHGATISAIESLASGGTRVVLMSGDAADTMRGALRKQVLAGAVTRTPLRTWPR